jgi:hypothetical protein
MSFFACNEGDAQMLNLVLDKVAVETLILKLYSNNVTPDKSQTAASFTECSGSGYAAITLTPASWTVTTGTGAGTTPTSAAYPQQTFTLTAALTAYGYFLVGTTSGKCYFAEIFAGAPYVIPSGGGTIKVTPNVTSFS